MYLKHSGENLISFRDYFLLRHHAAVYVLCNRDLIISKISKYLRKILIFVRSRYQNNPSYSLFCQDHAIVIYCHRGYREYSMVSFNIIRVVYIQIICLFSIRILSNILFVIQAMVFQDKMLLRFTDLQANLAKMNFKDFFLCLECLVPYTYVDGHLGQTGRRQKDEKNCAKIQFSSSLNRQKLTNSLTCKVKFMQGRGIVSIPPILIIQVNSAISSSMTSLVEHYDVQLTDFRFHATVSSINQYETLKNWI